MSELALLQAQEPVKGEVSLNWLEVLMVVGTFVATAGAILSGLVFMIRLMIKSQIGPVREQLETGNASTTAQLIKQILTVAREGHEIAKANRTLIENQVKRFDEHLVRGHGSASQRKD